MGKVEDIIEPISKVYDNPILQACYDAGRLGFDKQYLIIAVGIPEKIIREQFIVEKGEYYEAFLKGYYTSQTQIRNQIYKVLF